MMSHTQSSRGQWNFVHTYRISHDDFALYTFLTEGRERKSLAMVDSPRGRDEVPKPFMSTTDNGQSVKDFLQAAMDVAWDIGLRPINYHTRQSEIAAITYHLNDVRTLLYHAMGVTREAPSNPLPEMKR